MGSPRRKFPRSSEPLGQACVEWGELRREHGADLFGMGKKGRKDQRQEENTALQMFCLLGDSSSCPLREGPKGDKAGQALGCRSAMLESVVESHTAWQRAGSVSDVGGAQLIPK